MSSVTENLRAGVHLWTVAIVRLLRSRQTMISLLLLVFASLVVIAWSLRGEPSARRFIEQLILPVYVAFLLPIFCLCYSTPSIAGDREEGTLVYLLSTPMPRPLIHLAKYSASLALALVWTVGSLAVLCGVAGGEVQAAFWKLWPVAFWSTWAYVGLFHLLSVLFRRATIIALGYALFLETFVGNVPGIMKRVAISFYTNCLVFSAGAEFGMGPAGPRNPDLYQPISGQSASLVLGAAAVILAILGTWCFTRKEYS